MNGQSLTVRIRELRARSCLSQRELASRVGVSRQALIAIEAGRQNPSTSLSLELSRALGCRVEDLFWLPHGPQLQARLVGRSLDPGSRVAVGCVDGRWVAHPPSAPQHPADGLLPAGGEATQEVVVEPLAPVWGLENNVLVAGCAPLLGLLAARLGRTGQRARATWIPASSASALELLQGGAVHVAGVHLAEASDARTHEQVAQRALPGQAAVLIHLLRWRQGLIVAPGNPLGIAPGAQLLRPDLRWVRRDRGAAAQQLLERVLAAHGPSSQAVLEPHPVAADHAEVARLVRLGLADGGVAIESAALAQGLDFIPLSEERFDLILPHARLGLPAVSHFLESLDRPAFRREVAGLKGLDLGLAGQVCNVPAG